MAVKFEIGDGSGEEYKAKVTSRGQLVVAPLDFSTFYNVTADVVDTGYNLAPPKSSERFIITAIHLYANKNVGAGDATVVLYEADSSTETTATKTIINIEMLKQTSLNMTGLNIIVTEGKWVNIKTDDDDIFANVAGYYIDA
jgi:hypothetical protein